MVPNYFQPIWQHCDARRTLG